MTWAKFDDNFWDHPKILAVGPIGELIQHRAIGYCARYLTDGFLPTPAVSKFTADLGTLSIAGVMASAIDWPTRMIQAGLWLATEGGYRVKNFLDYNRSKEQVEREREEKREGGRKGARSRWTQGIADTMADAIVDPNPPSDAPDPSRPVLSCPVLDPTTTEPSEPSGARAPARRPKRAPKHPPGWTNPTWEAYRAAYVARYPGADPPRSEPVNRALVQLQERIGVDAAPHVAAHYVQSNFRWYVAKGHDVEWLVRDCQKLHTEWLTGRRISERQAQRADDRQERGSVAAELIEEIRQERNGHGRGTRDGDHGHAGANGYQPQQGRHPRHAPAPERLPAGRGAAGPGPLSDRTPPPDVDR